MAFSNTNRQYLFEDRLIIDCTMETHSAARQNCLTTNNDYVRVSTE